MPEVPLNLVITVKGFEREYTVYSGEDGAFSHTFSPLPNESGVYNVRAVHPDLLDRPIHGQFVINRLSVSPTAINLNMPRSYTKTIDIRAAAGAGTVLNNIRLVYAAEDQTNGVFPSGIHLTTGAPVANLAPGKSINLPFTIWADNFAENGPLVLKVKSDESEPDAWAVIRINTHFSSADPSPFFTPSLMDTGVARGKIASETVTMKNRGLADLYAPRLEIVDENGGPAPPWVHLNTDSNQETLAAGES
ncbi:MAG: hypothetical protein GY859_16645, partial [Desulfobacterales bacterium]|nr:hypothetical protein [Desulfobacterales bacterium]